MAPHRFQRLTPYEVRNLIRHLMEDERFDTIYQLLDEETAGGQHAWYEVKLQMSDTPAYIADIRLAITSCQPLDTPQKTVRVTHFAIILSTVANLAATVPPALLGMIIRTGLWSAAQGFAAIEGYTDHSMRNEAIRALVMGLGERGELLLACRAALQIESASDRNTILASLMTSVPQEQHAELLVALQIDVATYQGEQPELLLALAPALSPDLLRTIVQAARPWEQERLLSWWLSMLRFFSPDDQEETCDQLLPRWSALPADRLNGYPLIPMGLLLQPAQIPHYLAIVSKLPEERQQCILAAVIVERPEPLLLDQYEFIISSIADPNKRAELCILLLPHRSGQRRAQWLTELRVVVDEMSDHTRKAIFLTRVASALPDDARAPLVDDLLEMIALLPKHSERVPLLCALAPILPRECVPAYERIISGIASRWTRGQKALLDWWKIWRKGYGSMTYKEQMEFLDESYRAYDSAKPNDRDTLYEVLIKRLAALGQIEQGLKLSRAIGDSDRRATIIAALLPGLQGTRRHDTFKQAWRDLWQSKRGYRRQDAITAIAPHLSQSEIETTLGRIQQIGDEQERMLLQATLLNTSQIPLSLSIAQQILRQMKVNNFNDADPIYRQLAITFAHANDHVAALRAIKACKYSRNALGTLCRIAPLADATTLEELVRQGKSIQHYAVSAAWLAVLVPFLSAQAADVIIQGIIQPSRKLEPYEVISEDQSATLVLHLLPYASPPQVIRMIENIAWYQNHFLQLGIAMAGARRLIELGYSEIVVELASALPDHVWMVIAIILRALVLPSGPKQNRQAATLVLRESLHNLAGQRALVLIALAQTALHDERQDLLQDAIAAARQALEPQSVSTLFILITELVRMGEVQLAQTQLSFISDDSAHAEAVSRVISALPLEDRQMVARSVRLSALQKDHNIFQTVAPMGPIWVEEFRIGFSADYDRARQIILPYLPDAALAELFHYALHEKDKARLLHNICEVLAQREHVIAQSWWAEVVAVLPTHPRAVAYTLITALAPLIGALAGEEMLRLITCLDQESRWWP